MKTAAAIVTNRGGRTCHAAIVARELGIPAVVGTDDGDARHHAPATGHGVLRRRRRRQVYAGRRSPSTSSAPTCEHLPRPKTRDHAECRQSGDRLPHCRCLPNDGVGLARMEFIIAEYIKAASDGARCIPTRSPDAHERASDREAHRAITRRRPISSSQRLAEGVGTIAAAFYPKPVIVRHVRLQDQRIRRPARRPRRSSRRRPIPCSGFRGASRYAHPAYAEGFALECAAMRRVREDMGLTNMKLMVPFCRRVEEAESVIATMANSGLSAARTVWKSM